jgi:uncharacterized BrkB/YihY/UPF0761 family membrane protein
MKLRIAVWASVGALVVLLWTLYISAVPTTPHGIARVLLYLTCPVSLLGRHPISLYLVLLANAATYALVGTVVEFMRAHGRGQNPKHPRLA